MGDGIGVIILKDDTEKKMLFDSCRVNVIQLDFEYPLWQLNWKDIISKYVLVN